MHWFSARTKAYYCLADCPEHGYIRGKLRIKKDDEQHIYIVKTLRLIDEEGIIRLQKNNAWVRQTTVGSWEKDLHWILEELTEYNDGGTNLPNVYLVLGKRIIDLSGMQKGEQIASLGNVELAGFAQTEPLILAATKRVDA